MREQAEKQEYVGDSDQKQSPDDRRFARIEQRLDRLLTSLGLNDEPDYSLGRIGGDPALNRTAQRVQSTAPERERTYLEEHLQRLDCIGSNLTTILFRMGVQSERTFGPLPQNGEGNGQAAKSPESILMRLDIACEWLSSLVERVDTEQRKLDRVI